MDLTIHVILGLIEYKLEERTERRSLDFLSLFQRGDTLKAYI